MGRVGRQATAQPGRLFRVARVVLRDGHPDGARGYGRPCRRALSVLAAARRPMDAAAAGARGGGGRGGGGGRPVGSPAGGVLLQSRGTPPRAAAPARGGSPAYEIGVSG